MLAFLAFVDEPSVLGETAGIEEQGEPVAIAHLTHGPEVGERHRLPPTGVVGHGDEHGRHVLGPALANEGVEGGDVHVALEGVDEARLAPLGDNQVHRLGAGELDVGSGGVEVGVVGHHVAGAADHREEDLLRRPTLMGGDDVLEGEQGADGVEEPVPRR